VSFADEPPPRTKVQAFLVPLGPSGEGTAPTDSALPDGTLPARNVTESGANKPSTAVYVAEFVVPDGLAGDYQLILDWRHGADDGEYVAVGNDDPYSVFHIVEPSRL
jgi:hypothetical protein